MSPLARLLRLPIRGYQLAISPMIGPSCRFHPTCSGYALEAIETHGAARGVWLAARRIARCHPWNAGGYDPVPPVTRPEAPAVVRNDHDPHLPRAAEPPAL